MMSMRSRSEMYRSAATSSRFAYGVWLERSATKTQRCAQAKWILERCCTSMTVVPAEAGTHIPEAGGYGSPPSRGRPEWMSGRIYRNRVGHISVRHMCDDGVL